MKTKYILGIFAVLLLAASCVYASEVVDDDYKFSLPDKYAVDSQSDDYFDLKMDGDHLISVKITDDVVSDADTIKSLESQRYNVTGNKTFQYNGREISEITYSANSSQFYLYSWKISDNDDDYAIVALGIPLAEGNVDWNSSPVKTIFDTMVKK